MDTIQCRHCQRHSVPHLWHYRPFFAAFRYMKIQHICRFCGVVMYESGGGPTLLGKCLLGVFTLIFGLIFLSQEFHHVNFAQVFFVIVLGAFNIGFWGFVIYKIVRVFNPPKP